MNDATTTTTTLEGLLPDHVSADLTNACVSLRVDATVYPLAAVYGAAYVFIDRCFVLIDRPDPASFRVTLTARTLPTDAATLRALVGEFANELLACAWRHQITQDNRAVIEAVATQALAGAMGPPSLDELEQFDFAEETFEDPLGIAMSWEDKYKKKSATEAGGAGAASGAGEGGGTRDAASGSGERASERASERAGERASAVVGDAGAAGEGVSAAAAKAGGGTEGAR